MSKKILQDIINDFNPEHFINFFRNKNDKFKHPNQALYYEDSNFENGKKLEEIILEDGNLIVCSFQAKEALSERSGKKNQYKLGRDILKKENIDAGIFIFYDKENNFRFSLIYTNYSGKDRRFSDFRRFTYFVSPNLTNNTFCQRVGDGDFSSLAKIKEAFSVGPVTNKFFEEFRFYFERTKKELERVNKNTICLWLKDRYSDEEYKEQINKFTYTFLGRIIFIYFLQRKRWIENDYNFLRKNIEDEKKTLLYLNFLQPLFFEVFAKKENERLKEIQGQYKDTPYLNGGLFEKSDLELQLEKQGMIILLDDTFIKEIILKFFENYNFTIDENSLDDQEVSIDPEMLGKVFENTLAEEERGKKGTFYTPREIVHFMVKDSLLEFLKNETGLDSKKLHQLIYKNKSLEEIGLNKDQVRLIDKRLEEVKILDPAVGSAAFPVEMMHILVKLRKKLNVSVGKNINEVTLKKKFIKNNLYGVDIDPGAIEVAKLRLWLALIVDYEKSEAEALPNLDFQFRLGNSLQEKIDDIDIFQEDTMSQGGLFGNESGHEKIKSRMIAIKDKFYVSEDENEKRKLKKEFDELEHKLIQAVLDNYGKEFESQVKNSGTLIKGHKSASSIKEINKILKRISIVEQKIKDGTYKLFKPDFHFSEVFDRRDEKGERIGGFDIIIGNPPYGVKVEDDIKKWHRLGSKDSYGIFISTALKRFLKHGGVLSYIVSDTWLTIKTHKPLREQILEKQLHKVIRVHQDCFDATVNACILSLTNMPHKNKKIVVADLTNISTRKEVEDLREKLYNINQFIGQSTPRFAVYEYNQGLIKTNSNLPIFVGSPKLFTLMNDTICETEERKISGKKVIIRKIKLNNKIVELVRLGDIAEVKVGLQTGDNKSYLFKNPQARGSYRSIEPYKKFVLTEKELKNIYQNEELRKKVVEQGFHKSKNEENFDEDLWFDGRYIVPYDKGGESDTESGWLPNYYVPTQYYIDWSQEAIKRMKSLTIGERDGTDIKKVASRFQNSDFYFKEGVTFSQVGVYAPTYRLKSAPIFQVEGSSIFTDIDLNRILGILCSKMNKFLFKNFLDQTVAATTDTEKEIPFCVSEDQKIIKLVSQIIEKQKQNPRYGYMSNEQKEIDKLVYEMYGLNKDDIREVEMWYARRYPKLARFCDIK